MAYLTKTLQQNTAALKQGIVDKHYLRKHGKNAYYGQK
jgi:L-ribulose-5-phosphate 4-epimerase